MASEVDKVQAALMAAVKAECAKWTKEHPESFTQKDGALGYKEIPPTRGFVEGCVRAALNVDELVAAAVHDAMAANVRPEKVEK